MSFSFNKISITYQNDFLPKVHLKEKKEKILKSLFSFQTKLLKKIKTQYKEHT